MTRIRTLDFLPTIFQTPTNSQFLAATLDQLVNPPVTKKIQGYVGSKFGYGINAKDYYVTEPTKVRRDYQLEPGVVFLKENETTATDFISYPGILDALNLQGGITENNDSLFSSQFYSWDSFCNLDKLINYNEYYWLPEGPPVVIVSNETVYSTNEYNVTSGDNVYEITPLGATSPSYNPTLTLIRGGIYVFKVSQDSGFWIQGAPGINGTSPSQENFSVRLPFIEGVGGVINNGSESGFITFKVPLKNSMDQYNYQGNNTVGVVSTKRFNQINGKKLSEVGSIDGVTALNGITLMFYNTGGSASYYNNFYNISFDNPTATDPTIILTQGAPIPTNERITPLYGKQYVGIPFVRKITGGIGVIEEIPYLFAPLDTLYYQDSKNPSKVGVIKLIENNDVNTLNIATQILGQKNFTASNGVTLTNGLKIEFDGDVIPTSYLTGQYYVQGVGTSIDLVPVNSLVVPEPFTTQTAIPYDSLGFDIGNYDSSLYIPENPDYITIARNSVNKNAWSRSNRWFHKQVIDATATYNNDPSILDYASGDNKAKRPIIEFYPNLKLFNSGTIGKAAIDFIDTRTTDALSTVAGQAAFYPDVSTYTSYSGTVYPNPVAGQGDFIAGEQYTITDLGTTDENVWISLGAVEKVDGAFVPGIEYIITYLGSGTDWNKIAGTEDTSASVIEAGKQYIISNLNTKAATIPGNTTDFTLLGAPSNTVGQLFTATKSSVYSSSTIVPGLFYTIDTVGTTDWSVVYGTMGSFVPGYTGVAVASAPGTGTAIQGAGAVDLIYQFNDIFTCEYPGEIIGSGGGTALQTLFTANGTGNINSQNLTTGLPYTITVLGNTQWQTIGATQVDVNLLTPGVQYVIKSLGTTSQVNWNTIAGTTDVTYSVGDFITPVSTGVGSGLVITRNFSATGSALGNGYATQGTGVANSETSTWLEIDVDAVNGNLNEGMYINDQILNAQSLLPPETRILSITKVDDTTPYYSIIVNWPIPQQITTTGTNASFAASKKDNIDMALFSGARIVFAADENPLVKNKIYVANFSTTVNGSYPVITLTEALDGEIDLLDQFAVLRGQNYQGTSFYYEPNLDGTYFHQAQQKTTVNQPPKFDIFDKNGISFGNPTIYESTTFEGCELFRYKTNINGINDPILGFPITYSSINNVGDITFEVAINTDEFNYVTGLEQNITETQQVNTGYVYNFIGFKGAVVDAGSFTIGTTYRISKLGTTDFTAIGSLSNTVGTEFIATGVGEGTGSAIQISDTYIKDVFQRLLGWQTAAYSSVQYQIFEFTYTPDTTPLILEPGDTIPFIVNCDVAQLPVSDTVWPSLQVYNNNTLLTLGTDYTVVVGTNSTTITINLTQQVETVIQVAILSDQVSTKAYYGTPINLNNNPFNTDITKVDIGDIRGQYQSIFYNIPGSAGECFGSNNLRDLGNLVPWGNRIIQNSASLVLPGAFLRKNDHNLFDALLFNSKEYIKFKSLLMDTVKNIDWQQRFNPSALLDEALDIITSVKNQEMPFFWSDMIPNKAPYITNTYTFYNSIDTSTFPLSKIYNFDSANYDSVLVYLETTVNNTVKIQQLYRNIDYVISADSPSLIVTKDLVNGEKITIKEYNQTYGSYIPNTPTKLGLYPVTIPKVTLDNSYIQPTYFIVGHDGSYTKLYGDYDPVLGLIDYRDQVLLEFETRVYNNLKLSNTVPIQAADILPGYFRSTPSYYSEWLDLYSAGFLNWVGQNRIDYTTQLYSQNNAYTYNYRNSANKIDKSLILQGFWRGIYLYYYDTTTPDQTPWEMIGYTNKPSWWEDRYGPAPYTSDNLILWQDMENGLDWNNGNPVVFQVYARPNLSKILPVNDQGQLLNPLNSVIGPYDPKYFVNDWKIGDVGPVEFSYRRSSTWPFDLMRMQALLKPANFFNLGVDLDNYKYNAEFNQYLINNRDHLVPGNIQIYGNGTAKTSYINWIVDYEKQLGVDATVSIQKLLTNIDVRLVYRLAGFSDKALLKFFVEKGTPNSKNASLLIPDESYAVLLYENQPYDRLIYSAVVIQKEINGYRVYGNSQVTNYFKTLVPVNNGDVKNITVQDQTVQVANNYTDEIKLVEYGASFKKIEEVSQFLMSYGAYLERMGAEFTLIESGIELSWEQMVAEFLYWVQVGWSVGSVVTLNPSATTLSINKESQIVQPLTIRQSNFVLNQNLYPIENRDLSIVRDGTGFSVSALNRGDTIAYGQFNLSNIEHGIVFDNTTIFNDVIYNLITGLKQNRIYLQGTKSAEWDGTMFASGFIYNQDNIQEWKAGAKYTKGAIVKFKNKYWTALRIIQPEKTFNELYWKETDYNEVQKGLLPNSSTRSYESSLYYNVNEANLEQDADQLSFSLIGYRSRPYMVSADLTDITQVNVYKNMIKEKGTRAILDVFKGATLPQGGIDYEIYENWAILQGTFGGVLNNNFVEFKINQNTFTANPSIIGLTNGENVVGAQQLVPLYSLYNYGKAITDPNVLSTLPSETPNILYPDAGYVNFNDVKMSSYFYSQLPVAVNKSGLIVPINSFYVGDFVWLANYLARWDVMTPNVIGQVIQARSNLNGTTTIYFKQPHNLNQYDIFAIINFDTAINGYYVVSQIVNPYQIIIPLSLSNSIKNITGQGIAYTFQSNRVSQPSDIQNLPLTNFEFYKNKVWVDTNDDGGWAVYLKSNNYKYDLEFTLKNSDTFGSAVAYTLKGDYLFSDAGLGKVYRYQYDALTGSYGEYDELTEQYLPDQIISHAVTFGSSIEKAQNVFAISQPQGTPKVYLYYVNDTTYTDDIKLMQEIAAPAGCTNFGSSMSMSGDSNWLFVSDYTTPDAPAVARNNVHVYRRKSGIISPSNLVPGTFYQIASLGTTDFTESGAVENKVGIIFQATSTNTGTGTVLEREFEYITTIVGPTITADKFGASISTNYYGDTVSIGAPKMDYNDIENWGKVFVYTRSIQNIETQDASITTPTSFPLAWTPDISSTVIVYKNGTLIDESEYSISGSNLIYSGEFAIGDIINISGNKFTLNQILTTETNPRIGVGFGTGLDNNNFATEILVGAPFALNSNNEEGAVYRYTNGGARFGMVVGTSDTNITTNRVLLINGYSVTLPAGDAALAALTIQNAKITNVTAESSNGKLVISLIDPKLAQASQELVLTSTDADTFAELGIELYTQTQVIQCPHLTGPTQFGTTIKFNEFNSVVISAPVGTRYAETTFDFTDDLNFDNDTIFDNNATQFIDSYPNAGAVYMYDYLGNYDENLDNIGAYTYAQSTNDLGPNQQVYGSQPRYGTVLDFAENKVIIGTPNYRPDDIDGQVIIWINNTGIQDWTVYRQSNPVVDIDKIQNTQLFSAELNQTLINLDYFDPLQGKLLGAVRQNIDIISNVDPATYNNDNNTQSGFVWGSEQVGKIWFDTTNIRYVNYHQNDNAYNAKYWGTLFPGSDVAVYSWIASTVPPLEYQGAGVPKDINLYTVQATLNASNAIQPIYYFWVRNTGIVFKNKSLADTNLAAYISNPLGTGISYMSPLAPNTFALYNCQQYVNANDTVLHIAFSIGDRDDPSHQEYDLIRENYPDDFLPGFPNATQGIFEPRSLYDRLLDSLCGVNYDTEIGEDGQVVPDPLLPKAVQSGVLPRPRQSFFYNRFTALQNYLQYANSILKLYPITEIRPNTPFLNKSGEYYDTKLYWERINWWAPGYSDNTKSVLQVKIYADLSTLAVTSGTIVSVLQNGQGNSETYIYDENGNWVRIGLQNGTIRFKTELWDYAEGKTGFGDDFYGTTPYDEYPSRETRWIIRALNEQIYTNELLMYRNKSLILLFEYIQAETLENQNYLPWLNKTSLIDVTHKIRELIPLQNFKSDNQEFLEGYVNEAKPYHVVIKEFLFEYVGNEWYQGNLTDFDLPAQYNYITNSFITPELIYTNNDQPQNSSEFVIGDSTWSLPQYTEWYDNYGVGLIGQDNYLITTLASFVTLNSDFMIVDNASGFPINGIIKIADVENPSRYEIISYAYIDRSVNKLSGLVRGLNGTTAYDHLPGENIYIDLPAVVVLDGGKDYANPPRVRATIDLTKYPKPRREAVLEAVMNVDKVLSINVIDPGDGYAILPKIEIDPAQTIQFTGSNVTASTRTIEVYAPYLQTGDLVKYVNVSGNNVGGLDDGQWYYVNVLNSNPTTILALYTSYSDAIKGGFFTRVAIFNQDGSTVSSQSLQLGAKASAISSSYPIRENNITLRYDRTTYTSQVKDWEPGSFYGSFFAGSYNNTENVASSSIELESTLPSINNILASNQGLVLPLATVSNESTTDWSEFERTVYTTAATNIITLNVDTITENASGSTIGFTVGMPVKFAGDVGSSNIVEGTTYYIAEVVSDTEFKISSTQYGPVFALGNQTISGLGLKCFTATVTDKAIITTYYPGIRTVTASNATDGTLTVPLTPVGQGGTRGMYTGIPIEFVGNVFGGIEENLIYFVTSVIDNQTFTLTDTDSFVRLKALSINAANQIIVESTNGISVGDRIVFSNMTITGNPVTTFGNIVQGNFYYVKSIGINVITISQTLNGSVFPLSAVASAGNTYCFFVSQENNIDLTNATGSMTVNIQLPASPGQVDGQYFTFYPTSQQYTNVASISYGNLLERTIERTMATANVAVISSESGGRQGMYIGMPFTVTTGIGGLTAGTTYYIDNVSNITVTVLATSVTTNVLTVDPSTPTSNLYVDMPIVFTGASLGGVLINVKYYVDSIVSATEFTIKQSLTSPTFEVTSMAGEMIGTGEPIISVLGQTLSNAVGPVDFAQKITVDPVFDISYVLGGYKAIIVNGGQGFTINNTILVKGNLIGGTTPANDLTIQVNRINPIVSGTYSWSLPVESDGTITNVICNGTPAGQSAGYYLKVRSATSFEVYSDPNLTVPVSGIDFPYIGFTTTNATASDAGTNEFTVTDSSNFELGDPVVFTGTMFGNVTLGKVYYVKTIPSSTTLTLTATAGGSTFTPATATGNMTLAKAGSFMLLPEPFFFTQSIVKHNNKVWICVVSNNDSDFVLGKWEELNSGDRRLNAMDRVKGYYQPRINMPGAELEQLFTGVTYPNATYRGNAFDPADQYTLDTQLIDQPFYPKNVNIASVTFNGVNYIAPANLPSSSVLAMDLEVSDDWLLGKVSDYPLGLTDILNNNGMYFMTASSSATPILKSVDGKGWSVNGYFIPYGTETDEIPFARKLLTQAQLSFNSIVYGNGKYVVVGNDICTTDDTGSIWRETYKFGTSDTGSFYGVNYVETSFFTGFVAVGKKNNNRFVVYSSDGIAWTELNESNFVGASTETLKAVTANEFYIIVVGEGGVIYKATSLTTWTLVNTITDDLNDVNYNDNVFAAVGANGKLVTSTNGTTWTTKYTDTINNLNVIYYEPITGTYTIGGNDNTLLQSYTLAPDTITWDKSQVFSVPAPAYTVVGDPFMSGYGPEELVPGVVTDQLTMIVTTRPGSNWDATEYAHVGYNVVSLELAANVDNLYSFAGAVQIPALVSVYITENGLSTALHEGYTVDYVNKTVTLDSNIVGSQKLRIDVYEVGNGDQLVKSNTQTNPLITNSATGFQEVLLNCNYSNYRFTGGGIINPATDTYYTEPAVFHNGSKLTAGTTNIVTKTKSSNNALVTYSTSGLVEDQQIVFDKNITSIYNGLAPNTTYYVKQIIDGTQFTISTTVGGPEITLNNGSGVSNFITNDYTVALNINQVTADLVFPGIYDTDEDYISFSLFNETEPSQYGFTIPLTQVFNGDGTQGTYPLDNYMGEGNDKNAIVEVNGFRIMPDQYDINSGLNTLLFDTLTPSSGDLIAVTSFNDTQRQYLNTQYEYTTKQVTPIQHVLNTINPYYFETETSQVVTVSGIKYFVADSPSGLINDQYVMFQGTTAFGDVALDGTMYTMVYSGSGSNFRVQDADGNFYPSGSSTTGLMNVVIGGQETVRVITMTNHNLSQNQIVRIDGLKGSVQLNDQIFYVHVIAPTVFDIYEQPFNPAVDAVNYPVTICDNYTGSGYVWLDQSWMLQTTTTTASNGYIITVDSALGLVEGTPVLFTQQGYNIGSATEIPEIISGQVYYISNVDLLNNTFTISETRGGDDLALTTTSAQLIVSQWQQTNVDRLWVTVRGERVPSSNLRVGEGNQVNILTTINPNDEIIITSMMPSATPNQMVYINTVDKDNQGMVFRANAGTRTWLTKAVGEFETTILVNDANCLTNKNIQTNNTPAETLGYYYITLDADKNSLIDITVYNNTTSSYIQQDYVQLEIRSDAAYVKITAGEWITTGDSLTITSIEGNLIYLGGEYMRLVGADLENNKLYVTRGAMGTGIQVEIPIYSEVYGFLDYNTMSQINYNDTWNKIPGQYDTTLGDPLQIATGYAPEFLRTDI